MSTRNSPRPRDHRHAPRAFTILELVVVLGILGLLVLLLLPATRRAREPARRSQCKNHLKQIALAMHNYHDEHGAFPPAYIVDAEGRRLHSWRTLLLPYFDQRPLYEQIDLTKPWNDPVNAKAYEANPYGYHCPSADMPADQTTYMAVLADNSCLQPTTPRKLSEITDGSATTLMIVEAPPDQAVHWMEPRDLEEADFLTWNNETKFSHAGGFHTAFADGHIRFILVGTPEQDRRAMVSVNGQDHWDE